MAGEEMMLDRLLKLGAGIALPIAGFSLGFAVDTAKTQENHATRLTQLEALRVTEADLYRLKEEILQRLEGRLDRIERALEAE